MYSLEDYIKLSDDSNLPPVAKMGLLKYIFPVVVFLVLATAQDLSSVSWYFIYTQINFDI